MSADFVIKIYGKCIFAGEHAALRDCPVIIFPVRSRYLALAYTKTEEPLRAEFNGQFTSEPQLLFWAVLEKALELVKQSDVNLCGLFTLDNNIPISAGMGASGALAVAIGRWFIWQGWLQEKALFEFSRELENLFHGESSGADIAIAIAMQEILFSRQDGWQAITRTWQPKCYLSHCGSIGITSQCIDKVKRLFTTNKTLAEGLDGKMREAVSWINEALASSAESGFQLLQQAFEQANDCFVQWGLVDSHLETHCEALRQAGAVAVKPTGSGGGGFVLSLWQETPPLDLDIELIEV